MIRVLTKAAHSLAGTSLSSHIQDSKMAAAPGSTFLAHFKDCILLRSHSGTVFLGPMET